MLVEASPGNPMMSPAAYTLGTAVRNCASLAAIHHRHLDAERREDAGVLARDDAGSEHDHRFRNGLDAEDLVRVVDLGLGEGNEGRPIGPRPGGNEDHFGTEGPRRTVRRD